MATPYDSLKILTTSRRFRREGQFRVGLLLRLICLGALFQVMPGRASSPVSSFNANVEPAAPFKAEVESVASFNANVEPAASSKGEIVVDSAKVRFQNTFSGVDPGFEDNREQLDRLFRQMQQLSHQDSTFVLSTLRVIGSASPEGSTDINLRVSRHRARALFDYVADHFAIPDSITDFEYLGRNWRGLYRLVESDPDVPAQEEVLALIGKALASESLSTRESNLLLLQLKRLKGGVPYLYMYRHLFPALRYAYLYVEYEKRANREIERLMNETIDEAEALGCPDEGAAHKSREEAKAAEGINGEAIAETGEENRMQGDAHAMQPEENAMQTQSAFGAAGLPNLRKPFFMSVRTNMLYDIAAVPNIGVDFYVGRDISISADWMYSWWSYDRRHRYWDIYGGTLGARWWFGKKAQEKPLTGHHVGIYAGALIFDFEWGGTGYMGGKPGGTLWDRCLVNVGLEYGYSMPVSRRLNIDFSIGLGYLGGNYIKYFPFDNDYYRQKEYKLRFFGPTKAEISLVWLLGHGNTNNRKGGGR